MQKISVNFKWKNNFKIAWVGNNKNSYINIEPPTLIYSIPNYKMKIKFWRMLWKLNDNVFYSCMHSTKCKIFCISRNSFSTKILNEIFKEMKYE